MKDRLRHGALLMAVALGGALVMGVAQEMFFKSAAVHAQENAQSAIPKHGMGKKLWVILVTDVPGGRASQPGHPAGSGIQEHGARAPLRWPSASLWPGLRQAGEHGSNVHWR